MRFVLRLFVVLLILAAAVAARYALLAYLSPEVACVGAQCASELPSKPAFPTLTPNPTLKLAALTPSEPTATVVAQVDSESESDSERESDSQPKVVLKTTVVTRIVVVTPEPSATPTPTPTPLPNQEELIARYGAQSFVSLEEMPADLQGYFLFQVDQVADFFNVYAEDIVTVLQTQNDGVLQIQAPDERAEWGVARIAPSVWNGWANPQRDEFLTDPRLIEPYGGLGFDWQMALVWDVWRERADAGRSLSAANAHPSDFEDTLAAVARLLARKGLTRGAINASFAPEQRLAEAIALLNGEFPLAAAFAENPDNNQEPIDFPALRNTYYYLMDQSFGVDLTAEELDLIVNRSAIATEAWNGVISVDEAANQLLEETIAYYLNEGKVAYESQLPRPWPFIYNEESLKWQKEAVQLTGHTLVSWQLDKILSNSDQNENRVKRQLGSRADARVFAATKSLMESNLNRFINMNEVTQLIQTAMMDNPTVGSNVYQEQILSDQMEYYLRLTPEYQERYGVRVFSHTPLQPMPRTIKPFGTPARYQSTGYHSGLDIRNRRQGGKEPLLYAVEDGYVVYVGPLYCNVERKCRGEHAIVIDHGNNLYTTYSHNSEAHVAAGDSVEAGQPIGRQGNEGYSRGSHLHFELVVGCSWSGDWINPWGTCTGFVNPAPWMPASTSSSWW